MQSLVDKKGVRSKLFTDVGEDGNRHKFRMVDLNHWHETIEQLHRRAIPVQCSVGLTNILTMPLHEAILDIQGGRMSVFRGESGTLPSLMVCYKETRTFSLRQQKPAGTLSSGEACTLLSTYHAVVANLVDNGILKAHHKSHHRRLLVDEESVTAFNRAFILVGALAKRLGLNSANLAEKLASLGIERAPFSALVTVYRREDVQDLDLAAVSSMQSYKTKVGRKSTVDSVGTTHPRDKKLIELVRRHGGAAAFIRKFGGSSGTLSQMMLGKKSFGPLAARRMEIRCGLEAGTLGD